MARTDTTEGQALWQPGGAEEDSRFREGDRHLRLACDEGEDYHYHYHYHYHYELHYHWQYHQHDQCAVMIVQVLTFLISSTSSVCCSDCAGVNLPHFINIISVL